MIKKIIYPALGYLAVALACGLAGYYSNPDRVTTFSGELVLLLIFLSLLLPVYINRAILYEQKKKISEADGSYLPETILIWGMGIGFPLFVLVFALLLSTVLLGVTRLSLPDGIIVSWIVVLKILASLIPAYVFGLWNNFGWQKDERVYHFRYRSFFPALATCILPFIFGWSNPDALHNVTVASLVLISAWWISLKLDVVKLSFLLISLFVFLITISVITRLDSLDLPTVWTNFIQVFAFGVLMTLVMGVSESWRVSTRIRDDVEYGPPGVYDISDTNLYISGTNLAASLFLPFFLITFLHPSTTTLFMVGALLLLSLQFILWFSFSKKWNHSVWSALGLCFGLALPILITAGTNFNTSVPFTNEALDIPSFFDVGGPITIFIGYTSYIAAYLKIPLFKNLFPSVNVKYFMDAKPCLALTGMSASIVLIIISFAPPILEHSHELGPVADFFLARARLLQVIYLIAIAAFALALFILSNGPGEDDSEIAQDKTTPKQPYDSISDTDNNRQTLNKDNKISIIIELIKSGRPTTAFVAAFFSWLIVVNHDYQPALAFIRVIPIALITMIGFIMNDIFDIEKDAISEKNRPIVKRKLSIYSAKNGILYMCGIAIIWEISFANLDSSLVLLLALIGVFLYSPFSHKAPLFKGLWTAVLTCTPMFYAEAIIDIKIPYYVYVLLVIFMLGRELLMDVKDYKSDIFYGLKTLPYFLGINNSVIIAATLMLASMFLFCLSNISILAKLISIFGLFSLIIAIVDFHNNQERSFLISRLSLFLASISAALSV